MESPAGRPDLDAIRSQLRERGYLKGPLAPAAGWLLGGLHAPSSFVRSNALGSLRVAVLGGPLIGVLAAAAVALANRPHFSQFGRFTLLAFYLTLWYTAALWLLGFAADSVLGVLARRGLVLVGGAERLAARAGLIVGAIVTIYLALLLRAHGSSRGGALAWTAWAAGVAGALLVGQAISRFMRLAALGTFIRYRSELRLPPAPALSAAGRRSRWAAAGALMLVAVALIATLAPWPFRAEAPVPPVPRPMPGRVVLVGIDGLDLAWFEAGGSAAAMPFLRQLEREGARYEVESLAPRVPPVVWTTIATGRPPEEHGIWGFQTERLPGVPARLQRTATAPLGLSPALLVPPLGARRAPISAQQRRARPIWQILDDAGLPAAVINWWATWPAASRHGATVSDRAYWRFHRGQPPNHDVAPPELQGALAARFEAPAGGDESQRLDGWHAGAAMEILRSLQPRLLMLYLPGMDILRGAVRPPDGVAVGRVAANVDRLVREIHAQLHPDDILMVLAEPGRAAAPSASGFLIVSGRRVAAGRGRLLLTGLDLMPTLLSLCGLAPARDLKGHALTEFLTADDPAALPAEPIDSYGYTEAGALEAGDESFDQEMLDRLRSLGYIR